jgi:hypothetical protein
LVKDRRGRLVLPIVSMMDILSGAAPLIVDVRQTGSGPQLPSRGAGGATGDRSERVR